MASRFAQRQVARRCDLAMVSHVRCGRDVDGGALVRAPNLRALLGTATARNASGRGDAVSSGAPITEPAILGIDPGITGGIACLKPDGTILAEDIPVVAGEVDIDALVRRVRALAPRLAVIEKAQAMPRQGVSST